MFVFGGQLWENDGPDSFPGGPKPAAFGGYGTPQYVNQWDGLPGYTGPWPTCPERPGAQQAYVTFLLSNEYIEGVLKLDCSLKQVHSTRPLIVFYAPEFIDQWCLDILRTAGIDAKPIQLLQYPNYFAKRFSINWTRLRLWQMEQYSKLVYMDSDMFVLKNVDHLFDLPFSFAVAADTDRQCHNCGPLGFNQAGLLVFQPCAQVFDHMVSMLNKNETLQFRWADAEQGFLNFYFKNNRVLLPPAYNFLAHTLWDTPLKEDAKVVHFTNRKPFLPGQAMDYHKSWHNCELDQSVTIALESSPTRPQ